jgi:hypothetical protein
MIGHKLIGNGPRGVIVFHGWLGDHTVFAPMFPYLDKNSYTYAFLDHRGYGLSRGIAGKHTVEEMAADGAELAAFFGMEEVQSSRSLYGGCNCRQNKSLCLRQLAVVRSISAGSSISLPGADCLGLGLIG